MTIVVIDGNSLIGSKLVNLLRQNCLDVVSTSIDDGVNTFTGEGLDEVLEDAEVVIDLTTSSFFEDAAALEFFETSGHNTIAAEIKAGVQYHITLSVVGIERLQESGYFRAKLTQEKLIQESPVPYTILRTTQCFEFLYGIADKGTNRETVFVPPALVQPIAADDVAVTLTDITLSAPANAIVEVAGPERLSLAELVRRFLLDTGHMRTVTTDANARYLGTSISGTSLIPGENSRLGSVTFEAWLSQSKIKAFAPKAVRTVEVIE